MEACLRKCPPSQRLHPEEFYKYVLALLVPFKKPADLKNGKTTWAEAFQECQLSEYSKPIFENLVMIQQGRDDQALDREQRKESIDNEDDTSRETILHHSFWRRMLMLMTFCPIWM